MSHAQLTDVIVDAFRSAPPDLTRQQLAHHVATEVIRHQPGAYGGSGKPGVMCGRGICALNEGHDGACDV